MGGSISSKMKEVMDENMRKQMAFQKEMQGIGMERQVQVQMAVRRRAVATQLAMVRERMYWWEAFSAIVLVGLTAGYMRTRHPGMLVPLLPLSFVVGYQADMAWGGKMERIIAEADSILEKESNLLALPGKPITLALVDSERAKTK